MLLSYSKYGFNNFMIKNFYSNIPIVYNIKNYINDKNTYLLDIREEKDIKKGFIKNSICTPLKISFPKIIPQLINKDKNIILINNEKNKNDNTYAIKLLNILGYKNIFGSYFFNNNFKDNKYLIDKINYFNFKNNSLLNSIKNKEIILDIREQYEYKETGIIKSSYLLPISLIKYNYKLIPKNKKIFILCLSGKRALIIYSYLLRKGFNEKDLYIINGGISNLIKLNFPLIKY